MVNEIDSEALRHRMRGDDDVLVVDIRTPAEVAQGFIPNATRLPMHLLPLRMNELPKDRDVVLYCRSGARSYQACAYLAQQGYERV